MTTVNKDSSTPQWVLQAGQWLVRSACVSLPTAICTLTKKIRYWSQQQTKSKKIQKLTLDVIGTFNSFYSVKMQYQHSLIEYVHWIQQTLGTMVRPALIPCLSFSLPAKSIFHVSIFLIWPWPIIFRCQYLNLKYEFRKITTNSPISKRFWLVCHKVSCTGCCSCYTQIMNHLHLARCKRW